MLLDIFQLFAVLCCAVLTQFYPTLCDPMDCKMPGLSVPHHLLKFAQVHVHCLSDAIQPSYPPLPSSPPAFNLSQHQHLFSELALHIWWPKYWSFSISPSNEYSRLIAFRMDWCKILVPQKHAFYQEKRNRGRTIFVLNHSIKSTALTSP